MWNWLLGWVIGRCEKSNRKTQKNSELSVSGAWKSGEKVAIAGGKNINLVILINVDKW